MYPSGVIVREFGFKSFVTQKSLVEGLEVQESTAVRVWGGHVPGARWVHVFPTAWSVEAAVSAKSGALHTFSITGCG